MFIGHILGAEMTNNYMTLDFMSIINVSLKTTIFKILVNSFVVVVSFLLIYDKFHFCFDLSKMVLNNFAHVLLHTQVV